MQTSVDVSSFTSQLLALATEKNKGVLVTPAVATRNMILFLENFSEGQERLLAFIQELTTHKFAWPAGEHVRSSPTWQSILFPKIKIPRSEKELVHFCQTYVWYPAALREAITRLHVSPTGIPSEVLALVRQMNKEGSPYAFALSPTTLHHNSLVDPALAEAFEAVPHLKLCDIATTYRSLVDEETLSKYQPGNAISFCSREIATRRMRQFLAFLGNLRWTLHAENSSVGVLLAGGLASAVNMDEASWLTIALETDVDLFVYGDLESDRLAMTRLILEQLVALGGILKQCGSVFQIDGLEKPVQVICSPARSPLGVLVNFDSSFIQIGYQGGRHEKWICTPTYNFFTPRRQTLLTRYNVRVERFLKSIRRGFAPVSDERGHLINPSRLYTSPSWLLNITERTPKTSEWIEMKARVEYVLMKGYTFDELVDKLGKDYVNDPERAVLKLEIDDLELFDECVRQTREAVKEDIARQPLMMTVTYVGSNETLRKDEKANHHSRPVTSVKRNIPWTKVSVEEGLEDFADRGNTLCNGFDIYTEWINSTLPLPNDGNVAEAGNDAPHVLLRNLRFVPLPESTVRHEGDKINVGTDQVPIMVEQGEFLNPDEKYPGNLKFYQRNVHTDPYREVEVIFLFGDVKTEEQLLEEWKRDHAILVQQQERTQKRWERHQKARVAAIERSQQLKVKSLPTKPTQSADETNLDFAEEPEIKLPEIPTVKPTLSGGNDNNAPPGKAVVERLLAKVKAQKEEEDGDVTDPEMPSLEEESDEEIVPVKEEVPQPSSWEKKRLEWLNKLKYEDLHRYVKEAEGVQTICSWELPMLIKAFANGNNVFKSSTGAVVSRSTGMVKVRLVLQFVPCMIFDVDDLFLHQNTIDQYPKRSYNAVVQLSNFLHWIVEPHEHSLDDVKALNPGNRQRVLKMLADELDKAILKRESSQKNPPGRKLLKMIREISDREAFETAIAKEMCHRPHPTKGLLGKTPLFTCSRLYVSTHETPSRQRLVAPTKVAVAQPPKRATPVKIKSNPGGHGRAPSKK